MHKTIHLHRGYVERERRCCDGSCADGGTCPQFDRIEDETPEQRHRFYVRLTFCVALIGFGVVTLLHGMGSL